VFSDLLRRLAAPEPDKLPDPDARLALTALLVRIARSDDDYAAAEISQIDRIVAQRYGLSPDQAKALRQDAGALEAEAPDTVRFTRAIKDAVVYEDRLAVVSSAWSVVLADGARAQEENALMRLIASLLGVSDVDSHRARQQVDRA